MYVCLCGKDNFIAVVVFVASKPKLPAAVDLILLYRLVFLVLL